jgi:catechol 2,3-dioxygenase-like lactoylglutathione lyase family enzyme
MRLNLVVLTTADPDRLKAFYTALGMAFTAERHGSGPPHFAGRVGDVVLELYPLPEPAGTVEPVRLGFAVDDVDAVLRSLAGLGVRRVTPPRLTEWGYRGVVRDPDGRAVELCRS